MNKYLVLMIATMISSAVLAKVTYDDAITSNESYYNQTESVHTTPSMVGLESFELQTAQPSQGESNKYGGSYTSSGYNCIVSNRYTGRCNCPSGYTPRQMPLTRNLSICEK